MNVDADGLTSMEVGLEEAGSILLNAAFDPESEALLHDDGRASAQELDMAAVKDRLLLPSLRFYFYQRLQWITLKWTRSDSDTETTRTFTTEWITENASTEDLETDRQVTKKVTKRGRSRTRRECRQTNSTSSALKHGHQERHLTWFAHGFKWTAIGIIFSWLGFDLAIAAQQSTSFVTLETPMYVDTVFEPVREVGMINLRLCYNKTVSEEHDDDMGCMILRLDSHEVNDAMLQVSTLLLSMGVLVGGFSSVFLTTASFWSSINLRPVGMACLFSFVLQSSALLFFGSHLCAQHSCHVSTGCYSSIFASLCWIVSCLASTRMDVDKRQSRDKAKVAEGAKSIELQNV
jgi:hypothetical protein